MSDESGKELVCMKCCVPVSEGRSVYSCSEQTHWKAEWEGCSHGLLLAASHHLPDLRPTTLRLCGQDSYNWE